MKHVVPPLATHGDRVEERQRVNGQPNGYKPVSEADLRARAIVDETGGISTDVMDQPDNISLDELYKQERKAKGWHNEESDYWS